MVANLASLVPRFLFAPAEEMFYGFFAGALGRVDAGTRQADGLERGCRTLRVVLAAMARLGLVLAVFAQPYAALALGLYGGEELASGVGPGLLRAHGGYIFLLALNGITECFMFAAMSKAEVDRHNGWLLGFSAAFVAAAAVLTRAFGPVGFIFANCVNFALRILRSCVYIAGVGEGGAAALWGALPSPRVAAALLVVLVATLASEAYLCCDTPAVHRLGHAIIGASAGLAVLLVAATAPGERALASEAVALYRGGDKVE